MYNVHMKYILEARKRCICIQRWPAKMPQTIFTFTLATGYKMGH